MSLAWFESISHGYRSCGKRKNNEQISDKKRKNFRISLPSQNSQIIKTSSSREATDSPYILYGKSFSPSSPSIDENVLSAYVVKETEMMAFFRLLEDKTVKKFLDFDVCFKVADNFAIACAFAYFKRCNLAIEEYNRMNFFCCLYLFHDVEEDDEEYKYEILPWALGSFWQWKLSVFMKQKEALWARMNYRAVVSYQCCRELMSIMPSHHAWRRYRLPHHGEAIRPYLKPPNSNIPKGPNHTPRLCNKCLHFYTRKKNVEELVSHQTIFTPDNNSNLNDSAFYSLFEGDSCSNLRKHRDLTTNTGLQSLCEYDEESRLSEETYCHDRVNSQGENEYILSEEE